jgi:hypothetical protein
MACNWNLSCLCVGQSFGPGWQDSTQLHTGWQDRAASPFNPFMRTRKVKAAGEPPAAAECKDSEPASMPSPATEPIDLAEAWRRLRIEGEAKCSEQFFYPAWPAELPDDRKHRHFSEICMFLNILDSTRSSNLKYRWHSMQAQKILPSMGSTEGVGAHLIQKHAFHHPRQAARWWWA